jgi:uncharacterized coiled-coil protein SlyX
LTVKGTTTQIDSTTLNIGDNIIELNYGGSQTTAGIYTKDATGTSTISGSLLWDSANGADYWKAGKLGNESKILVAGGDGVISSSAQLTDLNTFTASANSRLNNLETTSASVNTSVSNLNTTTASLNVSVSNLNTFSASENGKSATLATLTASYDGRFTTLGTYTASVEGRFSTLATLTGSNLIRLTNLESTTASLNVSVSNLNTFSASTLDRLTNLESTTASINTKLTEIGVVTGSLILSASAAKTTNDTQNIRLSNLETTSASLLIETNNLELFSASILTQNIALATITGSLIVSSSQSYLSASLMTASVKKLREDVDYLYGIGGISGGNPLTPIQEWSASARIQLANLESFTASANTRLNNLETTSASVNISISNINITTASLNTFSASQISKDATLATYTASVENRFSTLATLTGSIATEQTAQNNRLTKLEESTASLNSYTASLKTAITVVGSDVTLNGNLTVAGATTQINSTTLNIGDNIIQLNGTGATNAGLVVRDATASTTVSGSLLWDTTNDRWIAGPLGSEAKVLTDGMGVISGSGQLANYETTGRGIVSGSSQIVPLLPTGTVSGSSQVIGILSSLNTFSGSALTRLTALEVETANLETFSSSALTRLTALEVETANLESFTSSINTTIKAQLNTNTVISGSSQVSGLSNAQLTNSSITIAGTSVSLGGSITAATILNGTNVISSSTQITSLLPAGVVSGSSQIDLTATTNYASGILTRLNAVGVISGSSQISLGSAAGNIALATQTTGDYVASLVQGTGVTITNNSGENATPTIAIGQAVGTSANVQFSSIGVGTTASGTAGEIRATGDITAFFSSDIRLKENIVPITNALEKVNQISGNTYDWKEGYDEIHSHKGNDVGVIAQEIEQILPQIVTNRDNGFKAVQYEKIIPLLIEAIKELSAKVDRLENK